MKKLLVLLALSASAAAQNPKTYCGGAVTVGVGFGHATPGAHFRAVLYNATVKNMTGARQQVKVTFDPGRFADKFKKPTAAETNHLMDPRSNSTLGWRNWPTPRCRLRSGRS